MTMRETIAALGGLIVVIATMMFTNVLWAGGCLWSRPACCIW